MNLRDGQSRAPRRSARAFPGPLRPRRRDHIHHRRVARRRALRIRRHDRVGAAQSRRVGDCVAAARRAGNRDVVPIPLIRRRRVARRRGGQREGVADPDRLRLRLRREGGRLGRGVEARDDEVIHRADVAAGGVDVVLRVAAAGLREGVAQHAVGIDVDARLAHSVEGIGVRRVREVQLDAVELIRHRRRGPRGLRRREDGAAVECLDGPRAAAEEHAEVRVRAVHRAVLVRRRLAEVDGAPAPGTRREDIRREIECNGEPARTLGTVEVMIQRRLRVERGQQVIAAINAAGRIADLGVARANPRDRPAGLHD